MLAEPVSSAPELTLGAQQALLDGEVERAELSVLFPWNISCIHGHYSLRYRKAAVTSPEEGTGDPREVSLSLLTATPSTSRGMQQEKEGKQRESQLPGCPKGARCGSGWAAGAGASRQPEEERSLPALRVPLLPPHTLPAATPLPCREWHKFLCRQTLVLLRIATFRALAKSLIWPGCLIPECL